MGDYSTDDPAPKLPNAVRKVLVYSILLILGLIGSQMLSDAPRGLTRIIGLATMFALAFIMIHVGYEFEIDRSRPRHYAWDYFVAASAATLPWLFCTLYFVYAMSPRATWGSGRLWQDSLLEGLFAAPTSAGVLFSMLAAAGLAATWLFKKARVLAIFDDLHTILVLIPLKMILIGPKWQLAAVGLIIVGLLWISWHHLNSLALPVTWPWVMLYAATIVGFTELVYAVSLWFDPKVGVHLEVLLPAFALGCVMKPPAGTDPHVNDALEGAEEGPEQPQEQRVSTIVSACFMVLVGLSMPAIGGGNGTGGMGWETIAFHVVNVTLLSNLGKMLPALCYRREATFRERLALAIGMWPRGEVGAGVLVIAVSYGIAGPSLTVAVLSLALNLLLTGVFIVIVKRMIAPVVAAQAAQASATTDQHAPPRSTRAEFPIESSS
jgi:Kef-type K+ transport system membrane component KefB